MEKGQQALHHFNDGYNCAQSVLCAFKDELGVDMHTCARIASGFGGGVGRRREMCGAVSGMVMALGAVCGYDDPCATFEKTDTYELTRRAIDKFIAANGTIVCEQLLSNASINTKADTGAVASERTQQYYDTRPCAQFCRLAAEIADELIKENTEEL